MKLADRLRRTKSYRKDEIARTSTIDEPLPSPAIELKVPNQPEHGLRIACIMDTQVRKGVPLEHIPAAGRYIAAKQPDVVLCIGDWYDFPSHSTHDAPGSEAMEGRRYADDVNAGNDAMEMFLEPIAKRTGYAPLMIFTKGNHEYRPERTVLANPRLRGTIRPVDGVLRAYGWKVIPYLQPVMINGVAFCHYFPRGVMGKAIQSPSILLQHLHTSAIAGHQQGRQIAESRRADGGLLTAIISGSFYQHDEDYLSPLANRHWRGIWMLNEVKDGQYDYMPVSVNYLLRKWGK